mgnify:CR=1 FL=1
MGARGALHPLEGFRCRVRLVFSVLLSRSFAFVVWCMYSPAREVETAEDAHDFLQQCLRVRATGNELHRVAARFAHPTGDVYHDFVRFANTSEMSAFLRAELLS